MTQAVGAIFMSIETGRVMLNMRSDMVTYSRYWGFVGGKVEHSETIEEALAREIREEIGTNIPSLREVIPFDEFNTNNGKFIYYSYVILVDNEFIPELNHESSGYAWVDLEYWPKPLHPGAKATLQNDNTMKIFRDLLKSKK